jgi:hypothetical protein
VPEGFVCKLISGWFRYFHRHSVNVSFYYFQLFEVHEFWFDLSMSLRFKGEYNIGSYMTSYLCSMLTILMHHIGDKTYTITQIHPWKFHWEVRFSISYNMFKNGENANCKLSNLEKVTSMVLQRNLSLAPINLFWSVPVWLCSIYSDN